MKRRKKGERESWHHHQEITQLLVFWARSNYLDHLGSLFWDSIPPTSRFSIFIIILFFYIYFVLVHILITHNRHERAIFLPFFTGYLNFSFNLNVLLFIWMLVIGALTLTNAYSAVTDRKISIKN